MPRPTPPRRSGSKNGVTAALARIVTEHPETERFEIWFQDEALIGQKGRTVRRWYQRGMRPRMVKDQRHKSAYIFGAVCPARDTGAALVITHVSIAAMNLLLEEVASQLPRGTYAVMLIDNAGWHIAGDIRVPPNLTLLHLPPYNPEFNAIERVWQYLRDRYLSGRQFTGSSAIAAPELPRLHGNLAEVYRDKVARLRAAFTAGGGTEVLEAARALIERVEVHAAAEPGGKPRLELLGALSAMLRLAAGEQQKGPAPMGAGPDLFSCSAKVDAGTGFEPVTFRV